MYFYFLDATDELIEKICPRLIKYGIERVSVVSKDFDHDISALASAENVIEAITGANITQLNQLERKYNANFFPKSLHLNFFDGTEEDNEEDDPAKHELRMEDYLETEYNLDVNKSSRLNIKLYLHPSSTHESQTYVH
ncbi:MAG: hypothetical protein QXN55_01560 [Candidatus Nitrosotenuis sp.]